MRGFMKNLITLSSMALAFALTGCGVGFDDSSGPNQKRVEENQKLTEEYGAIQGVYEGTYVPSNQTSERVAKVNVFIYTTQIQESVDPNTLKPTLRVVLRGRMVQTDFVGTSDNVILEGQYESTTGRMRLDPNFKESTTTRGCKLGNDNPISLEGPVGGNVMQLTVERQGQIAGTVQARRIIGADVSKAGIIDEDQEFQRLSRIYAPIIGTYNGNLHRNVCGEDRYEKLTTMVYIDRKQEGTSSSGEICYIPKLMIRNTREFAGELGDVKYAANNGYDPYNASAQFQSVSVTAAQAPGAAGVPTVATPTLQATASQLNLRPTANGGLSGSIFTSGAWGDFVVTRTSSRVAAPDDATLVVDQLNRTYAQFTGRYRGVVVPPAGTGVAQWNAQLDVLVQMRRSTAGTNLVPVMHAIYTRPDFSDTSIGRRDMDATVLIDGCKPQILFRSEADPTIGNRVPGSGRMDFVADVIRSNGKTVLRGDLSDHRGYQGVMTVTK